MVCMTIWCFLSCNCKCIAYIDVLWQEWIYPQGKGFLLTLAVCGRIKGHIKMILFYLQNKNKTKSRIQIHYPNNVVSLSKS